MPSILSEENLLIPAPAGELELLLSPAKEDVPAKNITAVICHPNPIQGGTMTNKVVTILARTFGDLGIGSVRFNFRSIGKSTGIFDNGVGEVEDVLTVVEWARKTFPENKIWLAGFSFGAAMSAHAAVRTDVTQLVSIAPPVPRFGLPELPPVTCPWLVVQGGKDDVVIPTDVLSWIETRKPKPELIYMEDAGHFFHGQLMELRRLLEAALTKNL
jgi:alpha/beta superfamily hydrolase